VRNRKQNFFTDMLGMNAYSDCLECI